MKYPALFAPLTVGPIKLSNRIVMAPLTRLRSSEPGDVPTPLMAEYYEQRASAGMIITEATQVSFQAKGYAGAPGIHTEMQISAWQEINKRIHARGGYSVVQLWHTGRYSHVSVQPGNQPPVAPSAIKAQGRTSLRDQNGHPIRVETSTPRALEIEEIHEIAADFKQAVANARTAGFDMVEIHGAHGYLIHQFLSPDANSRTDNYGGSIENRARFGLEVLDAAVRAWSSDRVGFRIYPLGGYNGVEARNDAEEVAEEEALYLIKELARRNLAYLHISEPDWAGGKPFSDDFRNRIRKAYPGVIIAAGAYTPTKANDLISRNLIDAVGFGRLYIANPDLVERIRRDGPYNELRTEKVYGVGAEGYTDYEFLEDAVMTSGG